MKKRLCCILSVLFLLSGCSSTEDISEQTHVDHTTLVWYMPCAGSYMGDEAVTDAVNDIIHEKYPYINIDFKFVNMYEYADKLSIYLAAKEPADIVWTSDETIPYINYPNENIYKFLDVSLKSYAPTIYRQLYTSNSALYKIYEKVYSIPTVTQSNGLVPFLKIPTELVDKLDVEKLINIVSSSDCTTEELFNVITEYIAAAYDNNNYEGIDMESVSRLFPLIGYETFISTSDLIGYKISDPTHTAVDMLNTPSSLLSFEIYNEWMKNGYIRDDIEITYKTEFNSEKKYILGGAWGYVYDNGVSMLCNKNSDGYTYIALDNKYHTSRVFTSSAMLIPVSSKHSEAALKVLNLFYEIPELYTLVTYGLEGVHWENDNGIIKPISNNYCGLTSVVPTGECPPPAISDENIIMPQMHMYETAGMVIPSASSQFRKTLFDYTNTYALQPYRTTPMSNSFSNVQLLLDVYNGIAVIE